MGIKRSNRAEAIIAKLEEMERSHSDASYDTGYAIGESVSEGYDDGIDYSVQKIKASSIKLSSAFKNVRDALNKQVQLLKSEINDKKFNVKVDFSNIDMNSDAIKRKIESIISTFKTEDIIEFDAKGSEKQFENLISLYVKYEEKLKSLREMKTFSSNDEAIKNLNEQVVLASRLQEIFRFLDSQTDVSLPMLMGNRELNTIISTSISALERFNAVKEEAAKTKVDTGNFKNIEDILKSLKETIEGIKGSLEPISEIFKNEGNAMQNMATNGTASFNSLSEAVNALYNNLKNVEAIVDAISKKNFEVTNITQNVEKPASGVSNADLINEYRDAAKSLYNQILGSLFKEVTSARRKMKDLSIDDPLALKIGEFTKQVYHAEEAIIPQSDLSAKSLTKIKEVYDKLFKYRQGIFKLVEEINNVQPGTITTAFDDIPDPQKAIEESKKIAEANKGVVDSSKDMADSMSSGDMTAYIEQLNKIAEVLGQIKEVIDPLSKAFTTGGTLLNKMATSGAITMDTFIAKLKEAVVLSGQLATSPMVHTIIPDEGQVGFDIDSAGEMPDTKDSVDEVSAESQEFKELGQNAKEAAVAKEEFNDANEKVAGGAKESITEILEEAAAMEELGESAKSAWTTPREGGSIDGMNLPLQIVGENGQSAVRMFAEIKDRLQKQFNSPVQIKFQSSPNEDGELEATAATVSYVNKELGVTVSQMYDIQKNEDGILIATQTLEKAIIGTTKEAKNFDAEMEKALAKERLETFRKRCGSIEIDLTKVADAAENIVDDESLKKFNKELDIVGEKLKQVKIELKGENTLDTIASAEKKLMTLPTQVDTLRKKLAPLLKLDGADKVSATLDGIMVSYAKFMSADDADIKTKEFKNIINNLSIIKTLMGNLKMDNSMSQFDEASKKQIESYKKILEYRNRLNSGTLGSEESKVVSEKLKAEQQNFIQLSKELKSYDNLYDSENRLKLLSEARLKVLEKINESQAKAADKASKQSSNYGKATYNSATRKYDSTLGAFENINDGIATKEMIAAMDTYKKKYDELTAARQRFIDNPSLADNQAEKNAFNATAKATEDARKKLQLYIDDMQRLRQVEDDGTLIEGSKSEFTGDINKQSEAIKKYANEFFKGKLQITGFNKVGNEMYGTLNKGKGVIENVTVALDRGTNTLYSYRTGTKELGTVWQQMTDRISKKSKEIIAYIGGGSTIYKAISEVRKGVQYVKELDSALTELKKVTDETDESYAKFVKTMSGVGAEIGATVTNLTNMAAAWARLGYSMEQAGDLAKSTAVLLNVSEFNDAETASEALISTIQAYGYAADESMQVVDILNEVGNNFAVSSNGLATALQTSASALMSAGNDLEQSVAMVAAANKVLQDPSQVGSALRTISLRIRGTSVKELEALGEEVDGAVESVSKLQAKLEGLTGVDILTDAGDYKSTYEVLREIAEVWPTLSDMNKAGALELIAGKNRSNAVAAILTNIEDLEGAYEKALEAEGSAMRENEKYLDSIQGRIDQFNNAVQTMWNDELGSAPIKSIVSLGTEIIQLIDKLGLLRTVILGFTAIKFGQILFSGFKVSDIIKEISSLTMGMDMFKKGTIASTMASTGQVAANGLLATSFKVLALNIWGAVKAVTAFLFTNPVGWAVLAAGTIVGVVAAIKHFNVSFDEAKEKLKETSDELISVRDSLKSLNNELKTTQERIDELNGKETLTIAEQEELDKLIAQNAELERQIRLEEQREKILKKQQALALSETLEKDNNLHTTTALVGSGRIATEVTTNPLADQLTSQYEQQKQMLVDAQNDVIHAQLEYNKAIGSNQEENMKKALEDAEKTLANVDKMFSKTEKDVVDELVRLQETYGSVEWQTGDNLEQWQKDLNEDLEVVYENMYKLQIVSDETGQSAEDAFNWVASKDDVSTFVNKVKELENLDATNIIETDGFEEFIQELIEVGFISDDTPDSIQKVVDSFNTVEESAKSAATATDEAGASFKTVVSSLSSFEEEIGNLSDVYNEFLENGSASFKSLEGLQEIFGAGDMAEEYEAFVRVLGDSNSTIDEVQTSIESLATSFLNSLDMSFDIDDADLDMIASSFEKLGVQNARAMVESKIAAYKETLELYEVDLKNYAEAEDGKNAVLAEVLAKRLGVSGKLVNDLATKYDLDLENFAGTEAEKVEKAKEAAKAIARAYAVAENESKKSAMLAADTTDPNAAMHAESMYLSSYKYSYESKLNEILKEIDKIDFKAEVKTAAERAAEYYDPIDFDFNKFSDIGGSGSSNESALAELDWIDHYFDAIDNRIAANEAKLEDTLANVANITKRNDIINAIIADYKKKIPQIEDVIDEYTLRAQQLYSSFSPDIQQKISNGSIKISEYDDELADQIQTYFDYIGKKSEFEIELINLNIETDDKELEKFNSWLNAYEYELELESDFTNRVQAQIDLLEEQGEIVSEELYEAMIRGTKNQLITLKEERARLQNQLNAAMANGVEKGSKQWYEMVIAINDVDAAIIEAETSIESFNNALQDLHWEAFDKLIDRISAVADEAENLRDLLDTEEVLKNNFAEGYLDGLTELDEKLKDGKISVEEYTKEYDKLAATFKDAYGWTDDGVTALGLLTQEMENAKYRSNLYAQEIKDLTANYKSLGYSEDEYQEKLQELKDGQWDAIDAYESAKDAIMDLNEARVEEIKDGIQKQIDAYKELIEKQKESLQQQREQHEMAKEDKEYDDQVAAIQRKLRAMQNDTSASSIAQQKALRAELAELEEERRETEYERDMDAKEKALDDSLDLYTEGKEALMDAWDEYLTHEEQVMADSYTSVTNNVEAIQVRIRDLSEHYGIEITDAVTKPWEEAQFTLDNYTAKFEDATSTYIDKLGNIKSSLEELEAQANETANAFLAMLEAQAMEIPTISSGGSSGGDSSGGGGSSSSGGSSGGSSSSGSGSTGSSNKTPSNGSTVTVSSDATNFSSKSGNAHMASFVPGGSYTVMQTSGNQVLIGKGGVPTGWVDKSDLNGYATGTTGTKKNELAWVDENGLEEIVMHAQNGRLAYLTKGSSVIPHDISENLMELGKVDPKTWLDNNRPTSVPASFVTQNNNVDLKFASMIHIEHADRDSVPEIKDAVQKQLDSYMKTINNGIKKYSR